jgi:DNA-binding HxlR family transcriptional regulator
MTEAESEGPDLNHRWHRSGPVLQMLGGRWTVPMLAYLAETGGSRYQGLRDALNGISHKMLTDTLRRAERDGLITRLVDPDRVETATLYQLTDLGRSLEQPLGDLVTWAKSHWSNVEIARRRWTERNG